VLWIFLILLVLVFVVIAIASNQPRANVNSQADYERLRRLAPDDPLSNIGPNEYERAYAEVRQKKAKAGCGPMLFFFITSFLIGPLLGWMVYDEYEENIATSITIWIVATSASGIYWYRSAKASLVKPTRDEIAEHLGLND